jgi:hypothetical protein
MGNGITGIVIGDGNAAQSPTLCRLDHGLGGIACIRRVVGMEMQVEGVAHRRSLRFWWSRCQGKKIQGSFLTF